MKKVILLLMCMAFVLTSCNNVEVSQDSFQKVGQSVAGLLENYHKPANSISYEAEPKNDSSTKPNDGIDNVSNNSEKAVSTEKNTTEQINQSENSDYYDIEQQEETQIPDTSTNQDINSDTTREEIEDDTANENKNNQISNLVFDIKYMGYELSDRYPNKPKNQVYTYVEPLEDTILLILKFEFTNKTESTKDLSYIANDTSFKLLMNQNYLYAPLNTLLENDVVTGIMNIAPGETKDAILVFQIQKSIADRVSNLMLLVTGPVKKELLNI